MPADRGNPQEKKGSIGPHASHHVAMGKTHDLAFHSLTFRSSRTSGSQVDVRVVDLASSPTYGPGFFV
ncbi:hypothetical protein CBOM_00023 [Ceraceosorus bombacis]|uniref:Uncharacterized protein n=1 Tax=Ceraceosorus bombacis TaxID=401625 RepID=A0A0P1A3B0_9BASI|nr:hypothetical protein CBOM_00023 [Ceraceosorus bombacis]